MNDRLSYLMPCLLVLALLLGSCGKLSRDFPDIRLYTLDPVRGDVAASGAPVAEGLVVLAFTVTPVIADPSFLLRREGSRVERDFHNRFVVPPVQLLQHETASWLREGGLFQEVRTNPAPDSPAWQISGHLQRMEGDFSSSNPEAVLTIQYFMRPGAGQEGIRFFRTYEHRATLTSSSPSALVDGWNVGLEQILMELETDLATHLSAQ